MVRSSSALWTPYALFTTMIGMVGMVGMVNMISWFNAFSLLDLQSLITEAIRSLLYIAVQNCFWSRLLHIVVTDSILHSSTFILILYCNKERKKPIERGKPNLYWDSLVDNVFFVFQVPHLIRIMAWPLENTHWGSDQMEICAEGEFAVLQHLVLYELLMICKSFYVCILFRTCVLEINFYSM